jgi:hypothetical protein
VPLHQHPAAHHPARHCVHRHQRRVTSVAVRSHEELLCEGARLSREQSGSTDYCCNSTIDSISKVCKVGIWGIMNANELIVNLFQFLSVELLNYVAGWGHCISFSDK